ncbi:MAG: DUF3094 domain-containing protein [Agarilytica sp.]
MPELYPEDQKKVDDYLNSEANLVPRQPFKLWVLLGIIFVVLGLLTVVSFLIADSHGVI